MPKSAQYVVSWSPEQANYLLTGQENGAYRSLLEEGKDWLKWLEEHRAFAFHGRNGQINLLKEKRRRGREGYWYAYQRHEGRMVKRYIGRSEQLSMERLEEIAALLTNEDEAKRQSAAASQTNQISVARSVRSGTQHEEIAAGPPISGGVEKTARGASVLPSSTLSKSIRSASIPMQFEPLLMPKLQLPRLQKSLLPREHLLGLLDTGLEYKVTLVAGPAGYGKTTLISQWIAERSARMDFPQVASVTLDESDNDPIRFWHYIIAACQQFHTGFGKEALELLLANRLPPFKPLEMMLITLLNELSQLEHPSVLILDDVHVIRSSRVIETLSFFLDHLPTSLHLILLIRGDPPFSVARLHARNELLDIYPPFLAFSLEETRAFFEQELSFALSPKILRQMYERLEGWPTGMRLLARALRWSESEQDIEHVLAAFEGSYWSIQDYFLNEVLHMLPAEQQEFLLQTSVLPRVTASLCDAIADREDSSRLIEALHRGDLFLIPMDGIGEWSRYHSLFAKAMQQEARKCLGDERLYQIASRASIWYEEHGFLAEAIETALDATEYTHAARLIERFIESKWQGNALATPELYSLNRWLERLPEEELECHPDLCLHYGMTLLFLLMEGTRFPDGKERIHYLLQAAEQSWRDANNIAKLAEVFAFRALLARQQGNMLQAVTWARQSLAWLPQGDRTWRNLGLTVVGIGEILDGNLNNAREFLLEALLLSEQQGDLIYARATRGMLSWASFEQGELRLAAEQLHQMQDEARVQEDRDDIARTQLGLAQIMYQWNNLEEAKHAAHEALEIGEQMNVEEFQALATARLALIDHALGQTAQAQQRLVAWLTRGQTPISPHSYQLYRQVQVTLARIQLASGDLVAVGRWFASIERRKEILPLLQHQREQLLQARLLLAQREVSMAIEQLGSLYTAALQTGHVYFRLETQVVLVLAYSRQGSHEKARKQLHELLEITRSEGYLRLFLDEGEELANLLRGLLPHLREKVLLAYAQRILSAFDQEIGAPIQEITHGATSLLEPLSSQERKVLRLLAAGNSNAEIARELVVSVNTVRTQVQSIYRKLNVNNRVEASAIARQIELI
ncbi:MAG: LuxR C-terminal-related transcriptional regulator [Chloroflexota bacterium]|nr:LuxR C-terminal-related transcriptional regulator [Chloroflexota bacterium]